MAVRRLAEKQPESFAFTKANLAWAKHEVTKYPLGRQASAVIALLWRAQEQEGWVTEPAIRVVADMLDMPTIRVLEVATFYTMFHLEPVGRKAHIQVCGTTPCWLRGANDLKDVCRNRIHQEQHHVSSDGEFSWEEVECLGACVNAPLVQIGADTFEDLTAETLEKLLDNLAAGRPVEPGPQIDRQYSAPESGPTTLIDAKLYPAQSTEGAEEKPLTDVKAKKPTETASSRESPLPKAPLKKRGAVDETATAVSVARPKALTEPRGGKADDLKRISGVGPKIERILNGLGIYHYDQIAAWGADEVNWVDDHLKFKGRIEREGWRGQAKTLASGSETDFSRRAGAESEERS